MVFFSLSHLFLLQYFERFVSHCAFQLWYEDQIMVLMISFSFVFSLTKHKWRMKKSVKTYGDWKTRTSNRYFCIVKVFKAFFVSLDLPFTRSVDVESTGRNASLFFLQKMSKQAIRTHPPKLKSEDESQHQRLPPFRC